MNETKNRIPDRLHLYAGGAMGPRDEPMSLVEGDLIAQNLLIAAYDKPLTITELGPPPFRCRPFIWSRSFGG